MREGIFLTMVTFGGGGKCAMSVGQGLTPFYVQKFGGGPGLDAHYVWIEGAGVGIHTLPPSLSMSRFWQGVPQNPPHPLSKSKYWAVYTQW